MSTHDCKTLFKNLRKRLARVTQTYYKRTTKAFTTTVFDNISLYISQAAIQVLLREYLSFTFGVPLRFPSHLLRRYYILHIC